MTLDPVHQSSLSAQVVDRLPAEIVEGRWPLDERIPPEPELVAALGVARGTLREALRALQYTGMIEIRRGDRIAQLLVQRVELPELIEVDELDDTVRGDGGYGSSGGHAALTPSTPSDEETQS
jgi:DNA-binding GntR family transcriptional regulator